MATYTKVGPHNWTFRIRHTDKRTKQKKEFKRSGFYSKPDAEIAAADLKKQLDLGYKENNQETVVECIGRWLKTYKLGKVAKNTYQLHQSNLKNHIAPYFQKLLVTDFSHPLYQEFINHLIEETKLSKRSIEIIHGTIYGAMARAKINKEILDNPCEGVIIYSAREKNERKAKKEKPAFIPYDKIADFLEQALLDNYDYYIFFKFLIETGSRKGEAMALRWEDVDLKNGIINVEHTIDYDAMYTNDSLFSDTKTVNSERGFKITNDFLMELRGHQVRQNANRDRFGGLYKMDLDLVFCREDGSPHRKSTLFNAFRRVLKKADLPNLPIHSLRHTHSVLMLESGAMMKDLQMRLGHSSMQITEDIYSHTSDIIQNDSITKFAKHTDKILNRRSKSGQNFEGLHETR